MAHRLWGPNLDNEVRYGMCNATSQHLKSDPRHCPLTRGYWVCTRDKGHGGYHAAGRLDDSYADVWPQKEKNNPYGWKVGEPDPTPSQDNTFVRCQATSGITGYVCGWPAGHDGVHVASDGERIIDVFFVKDEGDPTNDDADNQCDAEHNSWVCTWEPGHLGHHVAGDTDRICDTWANDDETPSATVISGKTVVNEPLTPSNMAWKFIHIAQALTAEAIEEEEEAH